MKPFPLFLTAFEAFEFELYLVLHGIQNAKRSAIGDELELRVVLQVGMVQEHPDSL